MENPDQLPHEKSSFVSVLAWLMIIFNGFGLFMSIIENVIVAFIFNKKFDSAFNDTGSFNGFPSFFLNNIHVILPVMTLFLLFALVSSIGLLKRKEWARKSFLGLFVFGILYTVSATVFQTIFMNSIFHESDMPGGFGSLKILFMVILIVFSLGFILLFGWLFKKLNSGKIREEFMLPN